MPKINITGNKYNKLTVLKFSHADKRRRSYWLCKCACGKEVTVEGNNLKRGTTTSCGCYQKQRRSESHKKDITGKRFGRLIALKDIGRKDGVVIYDCLCDCGNHVVVKSIDLRYGKVKSCGCLQKQNLLMGGKSNKIHGLATTRIYNTWSNMIKRCYNSKADSYKNYGARGIIVCKEWLDDFMNFYNWAIKNGYSDELTIERIDSNGNYEPSNCKWATIKEQSNNKRNSKRITAFGETHTVAEWQEITGISQVKINKRLSAGYSAEQALQNINLKKAG